jgi:hypothetical protein
LEDSRFGGPQRKLQQERFLGGFLTFGVTVVGLARAMVDTKALSYPGYAELASV